MPRLTKRVIAIWYVGILFLGLVASGLAAHQTNLQDGALLLQSFKNFFFLTGAWSVIVLITFDIIRSFTKAQPELMFVKAIKGVGLVLFLVGSLIIGGALDLLSAALQSSRRRYERY